jgi:hypothetical protein
MQLTSLLSFCVHYSLLVSFSSARVHGQRPRYQARDVLSPIESLADSILGITTTQSAEQTAAAASTTSQTATTQDGSTITATPQVVTVVPTALATSSSSPISPSETSSDPSGNSTATVAAQPTTSSSTLTTRNHSTSQSLLASSSLIPSTPATPANPIQGLSSSSAGSQQAKQENGSSMSTAGLAVAVVFGTLIVAGIIYLFYRHFRGAKEKAAAPKSLEYHEAKRSSYFGQDAEEGIPHNPGLGLGRLKTPPDRTTSYGAQRYRPPSRAGSEDTLVQEPTLPVSPLDRREAPLPPLPGAAQESWSMVSTVDAPHPQALLVRRTDTLRKAETFYTPYRPEVEPVIGLAVPLISDYTNTTPSLGVPLPASSQARKVAAFERVRQVGGVYELS